MQALAQLLRSGQAAGLAAMLVALPAPSLPSDPQVLTILQRICISECVALSQQHVAPNSRADASAP